MPGVKAVTVTFNPTVASKPATSGLSIAHEKGASAESVEVALNVKLCPGSRVIDATDKLTSSLTGHPDKTTASRTNNIPRFTITRFLLNVIDNENVLNSFQPDSI
jgi:hypothetical protein